MLEHRKKDQQKDGSANKKQFTQFTNKRLSDYQDCAHQTKKMSPKKLEIKSHLRKTSMMETLPTSEELTSQNLYQIRKKKQQSSFKQKCKKCTHAASPPGTPDQFALSAMKKYIRETRATETDLTEYG